MTGERFRSYQDFWPFYVSQHRDPVCRAAHFVGTSLVFVFLVSAILFDARFFMAMPVAGYGFAWIGHFFFEKNRPATFTYPLWSLRGDFEMYFLTWQGRMRRELEKAKDF
jgi:hypothetical protein